MSIVTSSISQMVHQLARVPKQHRFVILPHINADGDAIASSLALRLLLKRLGYQAEVYVEEPCINFKWIKESSELKQTLVYNLFQDYSVFLLDHSQLDRLGKRAQFLANAETVWMIDHHQWQQAEVEKFVVDKPYCLWLDAQRSSTAEMVGYLSKEIIAQNEPLVVLDRQLAELLLIGIYSDTYGLRYSNSTENTFHLMSWLITAKPQLQEIASKLFDSSSLAKFKLKGRVFSKAVLDDELPVLFYVVEAFEFIDCKASKDDLEGIVSEMLNVEGVEIAILGRQENRSQFKYSLRSKGKYDVAAICRHFGGGGHAKAAGCTLEGSKYQTLSDLLQYIKQLEQV